MTNLLMETEETDAILVEIEEIQDIPVDREAMYRSEMMRAGNLRRWAHLLREKAADPDAYERTLLHTIEVQPGQPVKMRYCAAGLLELALFQEGTPHGDIWRETERNMFGDNGSKVIYQPKDDGGESYPGGESIDCMGLWPDANPFAIRQLELGWDNLDPALEPYSGSDLVYIPLDDIQTDPTDILEADKGLAELDGEFYVFLGALSDAGQKYWHDIAAFAERHADKIEAEARQPA